MTETESEKVSEDFGDMDGSELSSHGAKDEIHSTGDFKQNEASTLSTRSPRKPYKSFRKKYRKLRAEFDKIMKQHDDLEGLDRASRKTLRRLNTENAQLLDVLLDLCNGKINKEVRIEGVNEDGEMIDELSISSAELSRERKIKEWLRKSASTSGNENHESEGPDNYSNGHASDQPSTPPHLRDDLTLLQEDLEYDI
ncbi:IEC3 subunit of the Ino80 complex, chromatin re-modelling-domain-containing protein [Dipodascopsis uninucleata]